MAWEGEDAGGVSCVFSLVFSFSGLGVVGYGIFGIEIYHSNFVEVNPETKHVRQVFDF